MASRPGLEAALVLLAVVSVGPKLSGSPKKGVVRRVCAVKERREYSNAHPYGDHVKGEPRPSLPRLFTIVERLAQIRRRKRNGR
jgi:hypothetical protein